MRTVAAAALLAAFGLAAGGCGRCCPHEAPAPPPPRAAPPAAPAAPEPQAAAAAPERPYWEPSPEAKARILERHPVLTEPHTGPTISDEVMAMTGGIERVGHIRRDILAQRQAARRGELAEASRALHAAETALRRDDYRIGELHDGYQAAQREYRAAMEEHEAYREARRVMELRLQAHLDAGAPAAGPDDGALTAGARALYDVEVALRRDDPGISERFAVMQAAQRDYRAELESREAYRAAWAQMDTHRRAYAETANATTRNMKEMHHE